LACASDDELGLRKSNPRHGDADGVGYDAVDAALAWASKEIEEQRRRLSDERA
jgi:hypothetical protein